MRITLPEHVKQIIETLTTHGYEAYAVGGCVRDSLLGREPMDWDITTSAKPEQVKSLFLRTIDTGIQHGTVTVMMERTGYEVTTYRIDGEYEDARHPKEVSFTANLLEDLKRRDFTINAMAYNETDGLVDAFDGVGDLEKGVIRCVGNPLDRFREDALRMFRAVRFAAQLGFDIEEETAKAVKELAPTLSKVSAERIQVELVKLLVSDHPERMRDVYNLGLTSVFMPEFDVMMQTEQNSKHHCYSVGEHTIVSMMGVEADKILRLSMLFHDVAKPVTISVGKDGRNHFYGHPQKGEEMTRAIMRRLKFDNDTTAKVCKLVRYHDERPNLTEVNLRKLMNRMGMDGFFWLFDVKRADALAQSLYNRDEKMTYIDEMEAICRKIVEMKQCVMKKDMAITGVDLIAMGMRQGKDLGKVLDLLFEEVLKDPTLNSKEKLTELAHKYMAPFI